MGQTLGWRCQRPGCTGTGLYDRLFQREENLFGNSERSSFAFLARGAVVNRERKGGIGRVVSQILLVSRGPGELVEFANSGDRPHIGRWCFWLGPVFIAAARVTANTK